MLLTSSVQLNPDIAFTTDFAHEKGLIGHIVGSTFPLKETEIWNTQHILTVIKKIKQEGNTKVFAGYMRVTVLNVGAGAYLLQLFAYIQPFFWQIPRPETPPIVIAAYPTANNETGTTIADHILDAQRFCEMVGVAVLSFGADGAKAERLGQSIVRDSAPPNQRLTYSVSGLPSICCPVPHHTHRSRIRPMASTFMPLFSKPDPRLPSKMLDMLKKRNATTK